jgi:hypothetical protein
MVKFAPHPFNRLRKTPLIHAIVKLVGPQSGLIAKEKRGDLYPCREWNSDISVYTD